MALDHIQVKIEVEADNSSSIGDNEETFHLNIAADIKEALPNLDMPLLNKVYSVIIEAGPTEAADLQFLQEEDFKGLLKPLQCRRLFHHLTREYKRKTFAAADSQRNDAAAVSSLTSTARSTSSAQSCRKDKRKTFAATDSQRNDAAAVSSLTSTARFTSSAPSCRKGCKTNPYDLWETTDSQTAFDTVPPPTSIANSNQDNGYPKNSFQSPSQCTEGSSTGSITIHSWDKTTSNIHEELKNLESRLDLKLVSITKAVRANCKILKELKNKGDGAKTIPLKFTGVFPAAASTLEELGALLKTEKLVSLLLEYKGRSPMETCIKIFRRIFTKSLALQFSLTGLGEKRLPTKISFRDHPLCPFVLEAVGYLYPEMTRAGILDCCRRVFKGAPDWYGGRAIRRIEAVALRPLLTDSSAAPSVDLRVDPSAVAY